MSKSNKTKAEDIKTPAEEIKTDAEGNTTLPTGSEPATLTPEEIKAEEDKIATGEKTTESSNPAAEVPTNHVDPATEGINEPVVKKTEPENLPKEKKAKKEEEKRPENGFAVPNSTNVEETPKRDPNDIKYHVNRGGVCEFCGVAQSDCPVNPEGKSVAFK